MQIFTTVFAVYTLQCRNNHKRGQAKLMMLRAPDENRHHYFVELNLREMQPAKDHVVLNASILQIQ